MKSRLFSISILVFITTFPFDAFTQKKASDGLWWASKVCVGGSTVTNQERIIWRSLLPLNDFIRTLHPESVGEAMERNLLYTLFVPFQKKIESARRKYWKQPDSLRMHVARLEYDRTRLLRIFLTEKQWQAYLNGVQREAERERRYQKKLKEKGWREAIKDWKEEEKKREK